MKGYFIIALRRLTKQKLFSFITIIGLATGITASLLMLHYVHFERSYDKFHKRYDDIYRLRLERTSETGESVRFASCCPPVGLRIRELYPEVERVARILRFKGTVSRENITYYEERIYFAEPQFLEMFNFNILSGSSLDALGEQGNVFLTQSSASKYFGKSDPMGQTLELDGKMLFRVAGIIEDPPVNSHIKFDFLLSWPDVEIMYGPAFEQSWGQTGVFTYLTFYSGTDIPAFRAKLSELVIDEFGEALEYYKLTMDLPLQPLKDIHLDSGFMQEYEVNGDKNRVTALFIVAIFLIIVAWVNYIVLSTAQSGTRMPETGMRKIAGARRIQLIGQLIIEMFILNSAAIILSLAIILIAAPYFSLLTGLPLKGILSDQYLLIWLAAIYLAGIFIAGLYPALHLSSTDPSKVLKGKQSVSRSNIIVRKSLVVIQNFISLVILSSTLIVYLQDAYLKRSDNGLNMNNVLVIKAPRIRAGSYNSTLIAFNEQLGKLNYISEVASATEVPGRQLYWDAGGIFRVGSDQSKNYQIIGADYNYTDLFEIEFVAGRNFSREFSTDSTALILNEKAVSWMGFDNPAAAIGEQVNYWGEIFHVIGVVRDFHQQSPKFELEPTLIRFLPEGRGLMGNIVLKLSGSKAIPIDQLEEIYMEYFPGNSFDYFYAEDYYNQQLIQEQILGRVFTIFSIITVLITVLGVIGLAAFMIDQQKRDISIRKVLGDTPQGIIALFSGTFLTLIMISSLFAIPVSWLILSRWLETFADHLEINLAMFLVPLLFTLLYTGITVALIVYRESVANPVKNLRYE